MSASTPELRSDLLEGRVVLLAGAGPDLAGLGATVERLEDPESLGDDDAAAAVAGLLERAERVDAAVIDAASIFAAGSAERLAATLDAAWTIARAVATSAMIERGGGTIVLIAPGGDTGPAASAAADGLENMARALSVEWARFDVRLVAICPRSSIAQADLRSLVAWLCSGSGTYVSGCRIEPGA